MSHVLEQLFLQPLSAAFGLQFDELLRQLLFEEFPNLTEKSAKRATAGVFTGTDGIPTFDECREVLRREVGLAEIEIPPKRSYSERAAQFGKPKIICRGSPDWKVWQEYFRVKRMKHRWSDMQIRDSMTVPNCDVDEFEPGWRNLKCPDDTPTHQMCPGPLCGHLQNVLTDLHKVPSHDEGQPLSRAA